MRILARTAGARFSPAIAVVLALAVLSGPGERALFRALHSAAGTGQTVMDGVRAGVRTQIEPAVFIGGLFVSRSRNTISGLIMGCGAGAALGTAAVAAASVISGGAALPTLPAAAAVGCLVGATGGFAVGYPLDSWALALD
jgi:hypothetical protein